MQSVRRRLCNALRLWTLLMLCGAGAACAAPPAAVANRSSPPAQPKIAPARVPARVPKQPSQRGPVVRGEVPAQVIARLRADLSGRIGGARARAAVVTRAEAVRWSNGALGCPMPGHYYTQAAVPGYRVDFQAGGERFSYHAAVRGFFKLCPRRRAAAP